MATAPKKYMPFKKFIKPKLYSKKYKKVFKQLRDQKKAIEAQEKEIKIKQHKSSIVSQDFSEIKIDKTIYSNGSINKVIDRSFKELTPEIPPINIEGFFKQYNKIFYDIPKEGSKNSHLKLIEQSTEYLGDGENPKDSQIDNLLDRIEDLETQISEAQDIEGPDIVEENSYFKNGTVIMLSYVNGKQLSGEDAPNWAYLMERGRKRKILGGFYTLKESQGAKKISNADWVVRVSLSMLRGIKDGPSFTPSSFSNSDREWDNFLGKGSAKAAKGSKYGIRATYKIDYVRGFYTKDQTGGKWNVGVYLHNAPKLGSAPQNWSTIKIENAGRLNGIYTVRSVYVNPNGDRVRSLRINIGEYDLKGPVATSDGKIIDRTYENIGTVNWMKWV